MNLVPEAIAAAPVVVAAAIYAVRRLSVLDLELRTNREREHTRLLREQARSEVARLSLTVVRAADLRAEEGLRGFDAGKEPAPDGLHWQLVHDGRVVVLPRTLTVGRRPVQLDMSRTAELIHRGGLQVRESLREAVARRPTRAHVRADIPAWALALLDSDEADRCSREWAAHLHERISDGELREARADRWRFVRYAILLAITCQLRRSVSRSR